VFHSKTTAAGDRGLNEDSFPIPFTFRKEGAAKTAVFCRTAETRAGINKKARRLEGSKVRRPEGWKVRRPGCRVAFYMPPGGDGRFTVGCKTPPYVGLMPEGWKVRRLGGWKAGKFEVRS